MSTGFRKSMRSPLRGSVKISRRESWSMPSTPSSRRSSIAPSSRRPFGKASVSRAFMSGSPGDEAVDAGEVGAHGHAAPARLAKEGGGPPRLLAAGRLDDERALRPHVPARRARESSDHREPVAAAVEGKPGLVDPHLRRKLGHETAGQIRRVADDEIGAELADAVE